MSTFQQFEELDLYDTYLERPPEYKCDLTSEFFILSITILNNFLTLG